MTEKHRLLKNQFRNNHSQIKSQEINYMGDVKTKDSYYYYEQKLVNIKKNICIEEYELKDAASEW